MEVDRGSPWRPPQSDRVGPGGPPGPRPGEPIRFLAELGLFVRQDGSWPNGWQHWTVLSPGPWIRASFTVKPGEDLASRALTTVAEFSPKFERRAAG